MSFFKKDLRKEYRILRKEILNREDKEKLITDSLVSSDFFRDADCIFLYCAYDGEINTEAISQEAERLSIKTAYPFCLARVGTMQLFFSMRSELKKGMYGINEPDKDRCEKASFSNKSLCIVPGVAFGRKGERLGFGKGYYDRFLESFNGITVGLSFEECLSDSIPMEEHDKKIDYLITDKKIYKIL